MMCNLPQLISVVWMAVFASGVLAMADMARAADPKPKMHRIVQVFSADFCKPCKDLKAKLHQMGYRVTVKEQFEQPYVAEFPAVAYEAPNGYIVWDRGERIYNWQTERPDPNKPVQIILWRTK